MIQVDPMEPGVPDVIDYASGIDDDALELPLIGPTTVELPGGYGLPDGTVATTANVRELNGYDEEKLTRVDVKEPIHFITKLVLIGVVDIGGHPMDQQMLDNLLIGDRDTLVIGIRRATFGDELVYEDLTCPRCERSFDVIASIDEIEIKKLDDPVGDRTFEVPLIHGDKAVVRLVTHGDQAAAVEASSRMSDQNTTMLSRCIMKVGKQDVHYSAATPEEIVRALNMRDRALIIKELAKRQPGPSMEGVKISCPGCEYEDTLTIDSIGMFRL